MAFIHEKSHECTSTHLDIFEVPMTQTSLDSTNFKEYHPLSSIDDGGVLEYSVSGVGVEYMDAPNVLIHARVQIVKADDTAIGANEKVAPINLTLHSLFSEVDVRLNEQLVSSTHNNYHYRAYLESLLSYGSDAKKSQLTCAGYYRDVAGKFEELDPTAATAANTGAKKRHRLFAGNKIVDLVGRLHVDLFHQPKYLVSEVNLRLRLLRNKNALVLMAARNSGYKVKIHSCVLLARKAKLSSAVYNAHVEALRRGPANYPLRRVVMKTFTIPTGVRSYTHENLFSGQLPTRIVLGLVENAAYNGE